MTNEFDGIKVGDEVALWRSCATDPQIVRIAHITPTGRMQIAVKGWEKIYFNPNGSQCGGDTWSRVSISVLTPELRARATRAALLLNLGSYKWDSKTTETLSKVAQILKGEP